MSGVWRGVTGLLEEPALLVARLVERSDAAEARSRRGVLPRVAGGAWLHAASAGEMRGLAPFVRECAGRLPIVVTAQTRAGLAAGRSLLPGRDVVRAPFDLPRASRRAFASSGVATLVLAETELWPNWLDAAAHSGVRVAVVNARLSDRSIGRYRAAAAFWRPLLARLAAVAAHSGEDAARWRELGVPAAAVAVTGSMKHDLPASGAPPSAVSFPGEPLVVLGSLRPGEAAPLARALAELRRPHSDLRVVAAPRHLARGREVERAFRDAGFRGGARSRGAPAPGDDFLLLDTMGELLSWYARARVAVVGGTIRPFGGHNVAEPALVGVPVVFGPHTENCRLEAEALLDAGGGRRAGSDAELAATIAGLLEPEARERAVRGAALALERLRGATARTTAFLRERGLLEGTS